MSSDDSSTDCRMNEHSVEMVLVAALDEGRVIGRDGDLPWHLPADLRHFKQTTLGRPVIMGRRTFESLDGPLPGRLNIVLTGQDDYEAGGCEVVRGFEQALDLAEKQGHDRVMILGGSGVFRQAIPGAAEMILTVVHDTYEGDTYFPDFDGDQWEVVDQRFQKADDKNETSMTFVTLRPRDRQRPRTVGDADNPGPLPSVLQFD
jgi:dihydrofolate reductase